MKLRIALALLVLPLIACGESTPSRGGTETAGAERPPYSACDDPNEVRLAPHVCWNPVGSRWHVNAEAPGGAIEFDLELMAGGRARASDDPSGGPATDEWVVQENVLRVFLGGRWAEYRAELTNGSLLVGDATNVRGDSWAFRAERQHGGTCAAGELVLAGGGDPVCYSVAGSRWAVAGRTSFTVELGAGGVLTHDLPSDTTAGNDTWAQSGSALTLRFDDGATEYTATLSPRPIGRGALERFEGSARDAGGAFPFSAQAVPSYPPPFH
jgi:hypothetical protein